MLNRFTPPQEELSAPAEAGGFDLREAINFVWRRWKFIAGVTALALLIAAVYLARTIPLFTATTLLLLDPSREKAAGQDAIMADPMLDVQAVESQLSIITSSVLLRRVVERARLVNDAEFGSAPQSEGGAGLLASIRANFSRSDEAAAPPSFKALSSETLGAASAQTIAATESLKGAVAAKRVGQAFVVSVSVTSADPAKAARLANAVADAYIVDKLDARFEAAKRASSWLEDRLVELRRQLRESEEAVTQFRADNNLQATAGGSLNQEQLGQLNSRLVTTRTEAAEKRARLEMLQKIEARGGNISALPDALNSGAIADLRKQANDLSRQEADLLARYAGNHPAIVNLRAQKADVFRAIQSELQRLHDNIRNEYELAQARQAAIEKTLQEVTGLSDLDSAKAITLRELERNVAVNKTLFEDFLQRARVTQQGSSFEPREARVISAALPPGAPSSPKKMATMLAALVGGLIVGVGGAFTLELLNAGFTTSRQIEEMFELPLLASISRMEPRDLRAESGSTLTIPQYPLVKPLSRLAEAFRALRSAIRMSDVDDPPKVLQLTSTVPGEGKTTIALGLAASATQSGLRVLVVDGDLRRPTASRYFDMENNPGLVEYLVGEAELQQVMVHDEKLGVWVLPAGGKTQNPADLLGSERFRALIAALRSKFDLVLIDTPPVSLVLDPVIVSHIADKVVYLVRWAATARELVRHSVERVSTEKKKVAGLVFNHVNVAEAKKYGKYGYGGDYSGHSYKQYYNE